MQVSKIDYLKNYSARSEKPFHRDIPRILSKTNDVYFGSRQYIKDLTQTSVDGGIENKKIESLTVTRPNILTQMFYILNSEPDDRQVIYNSEIENAAGYKDCILSLVKRSKIKNINNFVAVFLQSGTEAGSITKTQSVYMKNGRMCDEGDETLNQPKADYIYADYVNANDKSEVKRIKSHLTYLKSGAKIKNIETNALIIRPLEFYGSEDFRVPVTVEKAIVTEENITSLSNKFSDYWYNHFYTALHGYYDEKENAYADVEYCNIGELSCKKLNAKQADIRKANVENCDNIIESNIDNLTTSGITEIQNSRIKNLNITSGKFILDIDKESKINNIKFEKRNGILTVKNRGQYIPQVNIINGSAEYEFTDITLDKFSTRNNLQAGNNVNIKTLEVEDDNATVVLSGNANVENIHFKKHGQVILKDDEHGVHPDINKINISNGIIVKDYPLKGLEKVAGMEDLKRQLREDVIEPLKNPELYKKYDLDVVNGFLMYGPPGCGKTFVAEALAEETGRYFVKITPSDIGSCYMHKTAENISKKFAQASWHTPSIIFIDETEAIAPQRAGLNSGDADLNEQVTELLQQFNNCKDKDILVICASNEPQRIDNAIKRTGRLDKRIYVGPPDAETREALFIKQMAKVYKNPDIDYKLLAQKSEYYTAEDIRMLLRDAGLKAMKKNLPVSTDDIITSLKSVQPSLSPQLIESYRIRGEIE